jgi:hypothetical protein
LAASSFQFCSLHFLWLLPCSCIRDIRSIRIQNSVLELSAETPNAVVLPEIFPQFR